MRKPKAAFPVPREAAFLQAKLVPSFHFYTNNPDLNRAAARDFENVGAAKCQAVRYAGQLLCDSAETFWDNADFELTVTDEKGLILFTMRLIGTEAPALRKSI